VKFRYILFIALQIAACSQAQKISICGLVELRMEIFPDSPTINYNDSAAFIQQIWYYDSLIIEESRSLHSKTDTQNVTVTTTKVDFYRFYNLREKRVFIFRNFSDTATPNDSYQFSDTRQLLGGFGFNREKKVPYIGDPVQLPDSTERTFRVKRMAVHQKFKSWKPVSILSFNCEVPFFFDMASQLSKKMGCPCTSIFTFSPKKDAPAHITLFDFKRDHLMKDEKKVFQAWMEKTTGK
jgi:hypothetical protein